MSVQFIEGPIQVWNFKKVIFYNNKNGFDKLPFNYLCFDTSKGMWHTNQSYFSDPVRIYKKSVNSRPLNDREGRNSSRFPIDWALYIVCPPDLRGQVELINCG